MKEKLKGVSQINKFLNEWLKEHDFDVTVQFGTDFSYDYLNQIVVYSVVIPQSHDELFANLCKDLEPELVEENNFVLSFFHELGHFVTEDDVTEQEEEEYWNLCTQMNEKEELTPNDYLVYYSSEVEILATQWGCKYIKEHKEEIEKFHKQIEKLIQNFYQENNVTDE